MNEIPKNINEELQKNDKFLREKKKKELAELGIPNEESFRGNTALFQQAMEAYLERRNILQSELEHLDNAQRKIARGDLGKGTGFN